jgi:hypothetical protein
MYRRFFSIIILFFNFNDETLNSYITGFIEMVNDVKKIFDENQNREEQWRREQEEWMQQQRNFLKNPFEDPSV